MKMKRYKNYYLTKYFEIFSRHDPISTFFFNNNHCTLIGRRLISSLVFWHCVIYTAKQHSTDSHRLLRTCWYCITCAITSLSRRLRSQEVTIIYSSSSCAIRRVSAARRIVVAKWFFLTFFSFHCCYFVTTFFTRKKKEKEKEKEKKKEKKRNEKRKILLRK